jgi:hypothetical protein
MTNKKKDDRYFEPNANLKKDDGKPQKRKLTVRFSCKEDVLEFTRLTGINFTIGKNNKVSYPIENTLENFF